MEVDTWIKAVETAKPTYKSMIWEKRKRESQINKVQIRKYKREDEEKETHLESSGSGGIRRPKRMNKSLGILTRWSCHFNLPKKQHSSLCTEGEDLGLNIGKIPNLVWKPRYYSL